ncbi:histidine phosphatase superfamily [Amylostereum chailletii]|nr:histidine phosphatase superfamily [Amylostereum chailletii]
MLSAFTPTTPSLLLLLSHLQPARSARIDPGPGFNGTGIYNASTTPRALPWNTYNYCNAPHVHAAHYRAPDGAVLVYLNGMMRHHKRTPDNLYPDENALNPAAGWDCANIEQLDYVGGGAQVRPLTETPGAHPFRSLVWNGTCEAGQLTRGGFEDAVQHGRDLWSVYHHTLPFLSAVDPDEIAIRVSPSARTRQVASGLLRGMDPSTASRVWPVAVEPSTIDSLVPSYACPGADAIRDAYQAVPAWTDHLTASSGKPYRANTVQKSLN